MTPEQRQEMRDKVATLVMEWELVDRDEPYYYMPNESRDHRYGPLVKDCQPDDPNSPASQLLGVIERMRELGWKAMIDITDKFFVTFYKETPPTITAKADGEADNFPDATILAALAAVEGVERRR